MADRPKPKSTQRRSADPQSSPGGSGTLPKPQPKGTSMSLTEALEQLADDYLNENPSLSRQEALQQASLALVTSAIPEHAKQLNATNAHDTARQMLQGWKNAVDASGALDDHGGNAAAGSSSRGGSEAPPAGDLLKRMYDMVAAVTGYQTTEEQKTWGLSGLGASLPNLDYEKPSDRKGKGVEVAFRLPYGKVTPETLPKELNEYLSPVLFVPTANPEKNPNATVEDLIVTLVPERRVDLSNPDPDGYVIWMTNPIRKRQYFSIPGFPKRLPQFRSKIEVKRVKGMGMGVFATRNIKRFETVLVERPYMVYPNQPLVLFSNSLSEEVTKLDKYRAAQVMLEQVKMQFETLVNTRMTKEDKEAFMSLPNSHKKDGSGPVFGIIRTNALGVKFDDDDADGDFGMGYGAIPRIGSRFNHSCTPDVQAEFHPKAFALQYTALRDIKAGSQIFASYTSYFMSKAERDEFLAPYGIQCVCRVCVNATPQTDQLRRVCFKMSQNWKKQCDNVWMKDRKLTVDVLKPLLEMKKRMEDEGLDTFEAGYYELWQVMMSVYSKLGMVRKMEECMAVLRVFMEKTREAQFWEGSKFA